MPSTRSPACAPFSVCSRESSPALDQEVLECHLLTGEFDYQLKVVTRNHRELERFLIERLTKIQGVDKIRTSIVLNEIKSSTALPMDE